MSALPRITELLLRGYAVPEIVQELPNYKASSLKVYVRRVISGFTPEQKARMEAARAGRNTPKAAASYHQKFAERTSIGPVHVRIGRKLLMHRQQMKMTHTEFSKHFEFANRVALSAMEQGYHEFTLSEVLHVIRILQIPVHELLGTAISGEQSI